MDRIRLETYSYRFAEQVLNSKLSIKHEIESILTSDKVVLKDLSRPHLNEILNELFAGLNWITQPQVFDDNDDVYAKMDFLKDRVGVEVEFGHSSFIGIDMLKFQIGSYSSLNKIDVGIYIVTTRNFQKIMNKKYNQKWNGSLNYEKVVRYLPFFKSAIQVPIFVYGLDL